MVDPCDIPLPDVLAFPRKVQLARGAKHRSDFSAMIAAATDASLIELMPRVLKTDNGQPELLNPAAWIVSGKSTASGHCSYEAFGSEHRARVVLQLHNPTSPNFRLTPEGALSGTFRVLEEQIIDAMTGLQCGDRLSRLGIVVTELNPIVSSGSEGNLVSKADSRGRSWSDPIKTASLTACLAQGTPILAFGSHTHDAWKQVERLVPGWKAFDLGHPAVSAMTTKLQELGMQGLVVVKRRSSQLVLFVPHPSCFLYVPTNQLRQLVMTRMWIALRLVFVHAAGDQRPELYEELQAKSAALSRSMFRDVMLGRDLREVAVAYYCQPVGTKHRWLHDWLRTRWCTLFPGEGDYPYSEVKQAIDGVVTRYFRPIFAELVAEGRLPDPDVTPIAVALALQGWVISGPGSHYYSISSLLRRLVQRKDPLVAEWLAEEDEEGIKRTMVKICNRTNENDRRYCAPMKHAILTACAAAGQLTPWQPRKTREARANDCHMLADSGGQWVCDVPHCILGNPTLRHKGHMRNHLKAVHLIVLP